MRWGSSTPGYARLLKESMLQITVRVMLASFLDCRPHVIVSASAGARVRRDRNGRESR